MLIIRRMAPVDRKVGFFSGGGSSFALDDLTLSLIRDRELHNLCVRANQYLVDFDR